MSNGILRRKNQPKKAGKIFQKSAFVFYGNTARNRDILAPRE